MWGDLFPWREDKRGLRAGNGSSSWAFSLEPRDVGRQVHGIMSSPLFRVEGSPSTVYSSRGSFPSHAGNRSRSRSSSLHPCLQRATANPGQLLRLRLRLRPVSLIDSAVL